MIVNLNLKDSLCRLLKNFQLKISNYTLPENWFLWYPSDTTLSIFKPRLSGSLLNVKSYIQGCRGNSHTIPIWMGMGKYLILWEILWETLYIHQLNLV